MALDWDSGTNSWRAQPHLDAAPMARSALQQGAVKAHPETPSQAHLLHQLYTHWAGVRVAGERAGVRARPPRHPTPARAGRAGSRVAGERASMPPARQRLIAGRAAGVGAACAAGQLPHLVASEAGRRNRVHARRAGRHRLSIPHSPLRRLCGGRHGSASVDASVGGTTRRRGPARRWRPGGGVLCHCRGSGVMARLAGAQVPAGQASAAGQRAGRTRAVVAGMLRTLGRVPAGVSARRRDGARLAAGGRRGGALGAARHGVRTVPARTGQRDPHLAGAAGAGVARRRAAVAAAPQPPPAHLVGRYLGGG